MQRAVCLFTVYPCKRRCLEFNYYGHLFSHNIHMRTLVSCTLVFRRRSEPLTGLTNVQLTEHYTNCIKLSAENVSTFVYFFYADVHFVVCYYPEQQCITSSEFTACVYYGRKSQPRTRLVCISLTTCRSY